MNPLVSVIVPIYNVERYLDCCIKSILSQTYTNLEIILVNDGSTDKCQLIIEKYAIEDKRIKAIEKENGGLSSARNVGLENATGQYCAFIDSDDYVASEFVETLLELCETTKSDIAVCDFCKVKSDDPTTHKNKSQIEIISAREVLTGKCNIAISPLAWNKLYSKKVYNQVRFPEGKLHEDVGTIYYFMFYANNIVRTSDALYYYRYRDSSIMGGAYTNKHLDIFDVLRLQYDFFLEKGERKIAQQIMESYFDGTISEYRLYKKGKTLTSSIMKTLRANQKMAIQELKKMHGYSLKKRIKHGIFLICPQVYLHRRVQ